MKVLALAAGALCVAAFVSGLFWMIASVEGWKVAAMIWGGSIAATAVVSGGVWLIIWGLS